MFRVGTKDVPTLPGFTLAEAHGGEMAALCKQLRREHDQLREIYRAMKEGDGSGLSAFGELLQTHTRKEERELFPLIESSFNDEQLKSHLAAANVNR